MSFGAKGVEIVTERKIMKTPFTLKDDLGRIKMKLKRMKTWIFVFLITIISSGCGKKDDNLPDMKGNDVVIQSEPITETDSKSTIPKEEPMPNAEQTFGREESVGTIDSSGKWTPPEESYEKNGKIYDKNGVVIGGKEEAPHKARPGSKG